MTEVKVKFKRLHPQAIVPKYAKKGDAGLDLTITSIKDDVHQVTYGFGFSMEIPEGYVGLVFPRSSIKNTQLALSNSVGVIDSGYRGEVMAVFNKLVGYPSKKYYVGDRGAQLIIIPIPKIEMIVVDELSETERGTGGFGSTGNS
jgi:dUTP pyrophosphatase